MPLRLFYAAGPGDVIGTYGCWKAGRRDPNEVSATFSEQFYALAAELGAEALVIAQRAGGRRLTDGEFRFRERAIPFARSKSAVWFHLGQVFEGARLAWAAWRFGAQVAIVTGGTHWFTLGLMGLLGVRVVPDMGCTLWPAGHRPGGRVKRLIQRLNGRFWSRVPGATMCVSPEIMRQVSEVSGGRARNMVLALPGYHREYFAGIAAPEPERRPFVVLFAGRIEREKGVFDLVAVMKALALSRPGRFEAVVCGTGSASAGLAQAVEAAGLEGAVILKGQMTGPQIAAEFARCHVVFVPTTAGFVEGLNRVAVEGVLAGRPVVVSSVCPAWELLGEAVVVTAPSDIAAYSAALLRLEADREWYEEKRAACGRAAEQFYDLEKGWLAAARQAVRWAFPEGVKRAEVETPA